MSCARYARVGRIARRAALVDQRTMRAASARGERSTRERSGFNARRTTARPDPAAFTAAAPYARHPLVVRSFASQITILDGAAITIQRVRQQLGLGGLVGSR